MAVRGRTGTFTFGGNTVCAKDVDLTLSATAIDATTRCDGGFMTYLQGLKDTTLTFTVNHDPANSGYAALRTAFLAGSTGAVSILDENGDGFTFTGIVTGFDRTEPLDGTLEVAVEIKPTTALTLVEQSS